MPPKVLSPIPCMGSGRPDAARCGHPGLRLADGNIPQVPERPPRPGLPIRFQVRSLSLLYCTWTLLSAQLSCSQVPWGQPHTCQVVPAQQVMHLTMRVVLTGLAYLAADAIAGRHLLSHVSQQPLL